MTDEPARTTQIEISEPSLDAIFRPRSVAVIGASTRPGTIGRVIFEKLIDNDFNGPVYPVHPRAKYVRSVRAYPNVGAIPDRIDLAVIAVSKAQVLPVAQECANAGVRGLVVITAGFREVGADGLALEEKILEVVRTANMRMVGPNCMGVICTDPDIRLDATFAPTVPMRGNLGFVSQSGALGVTILEYAASLNLGVSMFISIGNKADIAGNDVLRYWQNDSSVDVILMYLESFGRPQQFMTLAREISRQKPIVIVKSGRTNSGARAATSHTGALAGTDRVYNALFRQCGIIRADTIEEMFDFAMGFANQPLPKGNRVAIITNAGGPAIMAADACENFGLVLPKLAAETQARIRQQVVPEASVTNPVDLVAAASEDQFKFALQCVLQDENIDAVIVIFVPPIVTDPIKVAKSISEVTAESEKPVMGCFMGVKGIAKGVEELKRHRIPAFAFPESAAKAIRAMHEYATWRSRLDRPAQTLSVDSRRASALLEKAQRAGRNLLSSAEAFQLLQAYGIPIVETRDCATWDEIEQAANKIGFPVVLKLAADKIFHKTEFGAVKIDLNTMQQLESAYAELGRLARQIDLDSSDCRFLVQKMVKGGREVFLGIDASAQYGPMIAFGLGGIYVEVLQDIAMRIAPLTPDVADEMIASIKGVKILQGARGAQPVDFFKLQETLLRLSQLAIDFPTITEVDINPFLAFPEAARCAAIDVRVTLHC